MTIYAVYCISGYTWEYEGVAAAFTERQFAEDFIRKAGFNPDEGKGYGISAIELQGAVLPSKERPHR